LKTSERERVQKVILQETQSRRQDRKVLRSDSPTFKLPAGSFTNIF